MVPVIKRKGGGFFRFFFVFFEILLLSWSVAAFSHFDLCIVQYISGKRPGLVGRLVAKRNIDGQ